MPMVSMRNMVAMLSISLEAAEVSLGTAPLSRNRLPIMNMAISGAERGTIRMMAIIAMVGNRSFSSRETSLGGAISISRSFLVVSSFISGG